MATRNAVLSIEVLVDAAKAQSGLDKGASGVEKFAGRVNKLVPAATAVAGGLLLVGKSVVSAASRSQQAMGALDSVFGKNAGVVKRWASQAATAVGLSQAQYGELASTIGAQLNNLGVPFGKVAGRTNDMIKLGADLAATFGGSTAEAVEALSSALRGEADPAERYGLSLNQTAVNARLAQKGLDKLTGKQLTSAKATAIMELATEQAGGALGQFQRESDTASGAQQIMAAQVENTKSKLGTALLPIVAKVTSAFGEMAKWVGENTTLFLVIAGVLGAVSLAILGLAAALKIYKLTQQAVTAATKAWAAAQWLWNAAMTANPVGLLIVAIVALVAVVVILWKKNAGFRAFVLGMWKAIRTAAVACWNAIRAVVGAVVGWIGGRVAWLRSAAVAVWSAIRAAGAAAWRGIQAVVSAVVGALRSYLAGIRSFASGVWSSIRSVASSAWRAIASVVSGVVSTIRSVLSGILSTASAVFASLRRVGSAALDAILAPVRAVRDAFNDVVAAIQAVISWVGRIKFPSAPKWLSKIPGVGKVFKSTAAPARAVSAPSPFGVVAGASSPTLGAVTGPRRATQATATTGSGGVVVNIYGGLDSADAIARKVSSVLRGRDRRIGAVQLGRVVPT